MSGLYRVFHAGKWREVTNMFRGEVPVHHPEQATAVVLRVDGEFLPMPVTPGDIMTEWCPLTPPESAWKPVR